MLLALPIWAAMYVGTLERVPQGLTGVLGEGEELYVETGCAGCHRADGGGGIGPELANGEVHLTFTSVEDQMAWIARGSSIVGTGNPYSSPGSQRPRIVLGTPPMPGFGAEAATSLDVESLLAVTLYERTQLNPSDEDIASDLALAQQLDLMIESGELELLLNETGLSLSDVPSGRELTSEGLTLYFAAARALAAADG